jgi:hypothetical protein
MGKTVIAAIFATFALLLALPAPAQVVANDAYQVGYLGSGLIGFKIINTGQVGSPIDSTTNQGTVCADIYFFDANQEMQSCCSCPLTANELIQRFELSSLTGTFVVPAVMKIVADAGCDETSITQPVTAGLRAFLTNGQPGPGAPTLTETLFQPAPLTLEEQRFLGDTCSFVHYLGSGRGVCACAPGFGT